MAGDSEFMDQFDDDGRYKGKRDVVPVEFFFQDKEGKRRDFRGTLEFDGGSRCTVAAMEEAEIGEYPAMRPCMVFSSSCISGAKTPWLSESCMERSPSISRRSLNNVTGGHL
jgi:hypothetical protein